jgi:hypothetical protein
MEIIKILLTFISGGAVGSLINQWFLHRRANMQRIPLIERVNRLVSSELKGFVLARTVGEGQDQRLEEIQRVREFQFTLRNTSYIHLHNAEVQFEFPSEDVEARAERPAHSKTTPIPVEAEISKPWKTGFRWRIPELPPGDSIEFTFRAVDALSGEYEVALYGGGQVVIEKSKGEPIAREVSFLRSASKSFVYGIFIATIALYISTKGFLDSSSHKEITDINWAGCSLNVTSSFMQENISFLSQKGPWSIDAFIMNPGNQKCFVKWEQNTGNPFTIESGNSVSLGNSRYTNTKPRLVSKVLLFGPNGPTNKATVKLYSGWTKSE